MLWLLDDNEELFQLKENISKCNESKVYGNSENRYLEMYDYISQGKGYFAIFYNSDSVISNIFRMIDLYDNFSNI